MTTPSTAPRKAAPRKAAAKKDAAPAPLHRRVAAALREANIDSMTIMHAGKRYAVPAAIDDLSGDAIDYIAVNNIPAVLPHLLAPAELPDELRWAQWNLFKSGAPKLPQYRELFTAWNIGAGTDAGE